MDPHEEMFVRRFLEARFRDRHLREGALRRKDLWHDIPNQADPKKRFFLPNNLHVPQRIVPVLRRFSAKETGYCISVYDEFDGQTVNLADMPDMEGTIVSIEPGKLAYYQGENGPGIHRCFLIGDPEQRKAAPSILEAESEAIHAADPRSKKRKRRKK